MPAQNFEPIEDPVPSRTRTILEWLYTKGHADGLVARANQLREQVTAHVRDFGFEDDKGNVFLDLDQPLTVGAKTYGSVKREMRVKRTANEERLMALAEQVDAVDRLFPRKPVMDLDELYVLYQEGLITESDIDGVFDTDVTWALKAVAQ